MARYARVLALVLVLVTAWPVTGASAQGTPSPKDTPIVVGGGTGQYTQVAGTSLTGAFDRAIGEIDAASPTASPNEVKDASFRRRLLELRLLMDVNAFAYDEDRLQEYRDIVDRAYEAIGLYQDIAVIQKELKTEVRAEIVGDRRYEMNDALGPLRTPNVRTEMRRFLSRPLNAVRSGNGQGAPRIWDLAATTADRRLDAAGNAALVQAGLVAYLQRSQLSVTNIFDPTESLHFHFIRRQVRNVVILSAMYSATSDVTRDVVEPLDDLVDKYGDVTDAWTAYVYAQQNGMDTTAVAAEMQREFDIAQATKNQFVEARALDAMAARLISVRNAHRR
jgi:hypothetical protein